MSEEMDFKGGLHSEGFRTNRAYVSWKTKIYFLYMVKQQFLDGNTGFG
jgi:hypothetical protein